MYCVPLPVTRCSFSPAAESISGRNSELCICARMIFTIVAFCSDRRRTPPLPLPPRSKSPCPLYMYIVCIYVHYASLVCVCVWMCKCVYIVYRVYVCCVYACILYRRRYKVHKVTRRKPPKLLGPCIAPGFR